MKKHNSPAYEQLADVLRNAVLQGELKPGVRLKIDELAHRYKMSATPVRQALQALENEGIVVTQMNKGAAVRVVDDQMACELYDFRHAVIGLVVRKCVDRLTERGLAELEQLADRQKQAGFDTAHEAQRLFFSRIAEISGNRTAAETLARQWPMLVAVREFYGLKNGAVVDADQAPLMEALRRRDRETAVRLAVEACEDAKQELVSCMRERADIPA